jgi:hypothetical protein
MKVGCTNKTDGKGKQEMGRMRIDIKGIEEWKNDNEGNVAL